MIYTYCPDFICCKASIACSLCLVLICNYVFLKSLLWLFPSEVEIISYFFSSQLWHVAFWQQVFHLAWPPQYYLILPTNVRVNGFHCRFYMKMEMMRNLRKKNLIAFCFLLVMLRHLFLIKCIYLSMILTTRSLMGTSCSWFFLQFDLYSLSTEGHKLIFIVFCSFSREILSLTPLVLNIPIEDAGTFPAPNRLSALPLFFYGGW